MKLFWHYTGGPHMQSILRCGCVDVASSYVAPPEKPVAWFSADQYWERTVRKIVPEIGMKDIGMQEMLRAGIKLYRIGVSPEAVPLNWTAIRKQSGMPTQMANHLVAAAKDLGANPFDWRGSFLPVAESQWRAIEVFHDGWRDYSSQLDEAMCAGDENPRCKWPIPEPATKK
jgi:hypothetical protein